MTSRRSWRDPTQSQPSERRWNAHHPGIFNDVMLLFLAYWRRAIENETHSSRDETWHFGKRHRCHLSTQTTHSVKHFYSIFSHRTYRSCTCPTTPTKMSWWSRPSLNTITLATTRATHGYRSENVVSKLKCVPFCEESWKIFAPCSM